MSRVLLDTHTFIWFVADDANLPAATKELIEVADVTFVSVVSLQEIAIKLNIGKLSLKGSFRDIEARMMETGIDNLPIIFADLVQYRHLPLHHRDPFDRILVAQSSITIWF